MPNSTQKNLGGKKNKTIKTMKKHIINPPVNKKGIKYLIEPMTALNTHSKSKGVVIKEYVNSKLKKQIFVSDKKLNHAIKKISDKHKLHGGTNPNIADSSKNPNSKVEIESSDKTSFMQSLKSGFGSGLGLAAAFETIKWLFGSGKSKEDDEDEDENEDNNDYSE